MERVVKTASRRFQDLVDLVALLRGDNGCPWDREQTPGSAKIYLVEEAHELSQAIESGAPGDICGELGDLLFQILFLTRCFEEAGAFSLGDVIEGVSAKMIRRHPHVFGGARVSTAEQVKDQWYRIKRTEAGGGDKPLSAGLEAVPRSLPALMRAYRLGERAGKMGFDWPHVQAVFEKLGKELAALKKSEEKDDASGAAEALGEFLFAAIQLGRLLGLHPETAVEHSVERFIGRFKELEQGLSARASSSSSALPTPQEIKALWGCSPLQSKKFEIRNS